MRPAWYVLCVLIGTLCSWMAVAFVLALVDPSQASWFGMSLFYSSLFLALWGTLTLLGYFIKSSTGRSGRVRSAQVATRQGILFSVLLVSTLWLQANRLLSWFNVGLLVALLTLLEFSLISRRPAPRVEPVR